MRAQDYDRIVEAIHSFPGPDPTQHLMDSFPQHEAAVLSSIATQEVQKFVKVNYKKFSNTNRVMSYYKRYTAAVGRGEGPGILLDMANKNYFSPALLAKLVLEHYLAVQDELAAASAPLSDSVPSRSLVSPPTLSLTCEGNASSGDDSPTAEASALVHSAPAEDLVPDGEEPFLCEVGVPTSEVLGNIVEDLEENSDVFVHPRDENSANHSRKTNPCSSQGDSGGVRRPERMDRDSPTVSSPDDRDVNAGCKTSEETNTTLPCVQTNVREEAADGSKSMVNTFPSSYTHEGETKDTKCSSKNGSHILVPSANEGTQAQKKKSAAATKSRVNKLLRDTALIPDKVLSFEVHLCLVNDDVYGPFADTIKHSIGHEYEELLKRKLRERHISYQTEDDLRSLGCDKTPDTRLDVPIGVGGRVVNWIESKASFGDRDNHRTYLSDQLWSYWNRFGPGLVIYWFGFIDELNYLEDKGILVRDSFPDDIVTMDPLSVKSSSLCAT